MEVYYILFLFYFNFLSFSTLANQEEDTGFETDFKKWKVLNSNNS